MNSFSCSNAEPTNTFPRNTFTTMKPKYLAAAYLSIREYDTWPSNLVIMFKTYGKASRKIFKIRPGKKPCIADFKTSLHVQIYRISMSLLEWHVQHRKLIHFFRRYARSPNDMPPCMIHYTRHVRVRQTYSSTIGFKKGRFRSSCCRFANPCTKVTGKKKKITRTIVRISIPSLREFSLWYGIGRLAQ